MPRQRSMRWSSSTLAAALLAVLCAGARSDPAATLRLTAVCEGDSAEPSAVDVALTLPLDGVPVFRLPDRLLGAPGMTKLISGAEAADRRGPLPLARRVTGDPAGGELLELAGSRPATGTVTLRYRARSVAVAESGARHGLRHDATGIGGLGSAFLVLPETRAVYRTTIEWAPPACASARGSEGLRGLSSFGAGPGPGETTGPLERLRMAAYFAGHPTVVAVEVGSRRFHSAWFGRPAFDVHAAAAWAARAFAAERDFFGDEDGAPYHVFVRVLPEMGERSNGIGQPDSFLLAIGPLTPLGPRLRINVAHEMLHRWIGMRLRLAGPEGSSYWFSEGLTVYYAALLMRRASLISADELLSELNETATRHFANPHAFATNDEIRRRFFDDDTLSLVPYTRGALYAAELDAAIRQRSGGARSLDDTMRELYRAARATPATELGLHELPPSAFRAAVRRALGQPGVERFEAVIDRGAPPEPPSNAFGPCFQREPRRIATYQLGFDERRSLAEPKAIRGLVPGSAAARAGLVEGEPLLALEPSRLLPDKEAVVTVERAGTELVVRYKPAAGSPREGFGWVRVYPSAPKLMTNSRDSSCPTL